MMRNSTMPVPVMIYRGMVAFCVLVISSYCAAAQCSDAAGACDSFTKPFRIIRVAAAEPGRIESVNVRRGNVVCQGQTLVRIDSRILQAARNVAAAEAAGTARIDGLKVEYELQARRLQQFQALAADGLGSTEELHRAEADQQIALANLRAAQELQQQQELRVAEIETRIAARDVTSPIDGIVTEVWKEPGEFVSVAAPEVVMIVELSQLRASFFLPTQDVVSLNESQTVQILFPDSGRKVIGRIEHVSVVTEADSGRVRVDVVIDNRQQLLRSGIRCRLLLTSAAPTSGDPSASGGARVGQKYRTGY